MKITDNIEIKDLALYLKKEKILIIADIHMGYEEALNKQGILIPKFQFNETIKRLELILKNLKLNLIIINGDLKHEFGTISSTEWRYTLSIIDFLSKYSEKLILLKGNHDAIIGPIAKKRNLEIKDYYKINNVYICHGDKLQDNKDFKNSKVLIIGHDHIAISLKEKRVETYKCFLKGKYEDKILIAMPSFNLVTEGTDIIKEELLSPFLHQNLSNFNVYIVADKIYDFDKLGKLKKIKLN